MCKKLYAWGNDSEGGYAICGESESLTDERSCYDEYAVTRYTYIGNFSNKAELIALLKRDGEPEADWWSDILLK